MACGTKSHFFNPSDRHQLMLLKLQIWGWRLAHWVASPTLQQPLALKIDISVLKWVSRNWAISTGKPKFHSSTNFHSKTTNYVNRLKIPWAAENYGPYISTNTVNNNYVITKGQFTTSVKTNLSVASNSFTGFIQQCDSSFPYFSKTKFMSFSILFKASRRKLGP